MHSQNTLELARQGDPKAIATILTYHLSQRFNTTASVIRLGNYLSILIDASFPLDQTVLVELVLNILNGLNIEEIVTLEIGAREIGHHEVQWSQTIELADIRTHPPAMNNNSTDLKTSTTDGASTASNEIEPNVSLLTATTSTRPPTPSSSESEVQDNDWDSTLKKLLQRPEMLALVAFALILVLFDTYAEWMADIDPTQPLSGVKLARRLGISTSTLKRYRQRPNFSQWSQDLDPDGIAWVYENHAFVPQLETFPKVAV